MENEKLTIVKFYKATEEDWRNPNIYVDTDPSDSSCESEGDSADEFHTPLTARKLFHDENEKETDKDTCVGIAALNVGSESLKEDCSKDLHELSEISEQLNLPDSNTSFHKKPEKQGGLNCALSLLETTARFARSPFRKCMRGGRKLLVRKTSD